MIAVHSEGVAVRSVSNTTGGEPQISNSSPGNRTQSDGLKVRYADHHTREALHDLEFEISNPDYPTEESNLV